MYGFWEVRIYILFLILFQPILFIKIYVLKQDVPGGDSAISSVVCFLVPMCPNALLLKQRRLIIY